MKKLITEMEKGKQISFFSAVLMLFTMLVGTRYYLNENIYKAFNLGNLGGAGGKIELSTLFAVCLALGFIVGVALSLFSRRILKGRGVICAYATAALMAIVLLLFTPYNIQLITPTQNLQNIAMINCFVVLLFSTIAVGLATFAIVAHILSVINGSNIATLISMIVSVAIAIIIAFAALASRWSYAVCVAVYASVLLLSNIIHSIFFKDGVVAIAQNMTLSAESSASEKTESEKIENEKVENEKVESEKIESEKIESEKIESEKIANEKAEIITSIAGITETSKKFCLSNFKLSKREIIALSLLSIIVIALLVGGCFITAPLIAIIG